MAEITRRDTFRLAVGAGAAAAMPAALAEIASSATVVTAQEGLAPQFWMVLYDGYGREVERRAVDGAVSFEDGVVALRLGDQDFTLDHCRRIARVDVGFGDVFGHSIETDIALSDGDTVTIEFDGPAIVVEA